MSNAVLNVDPQKKDDMYYRYKMPAALIKIEGSGNGIKTVIPNIRDICKVLKRPEEILLKFLGNELGAQSTFVKDADKFLVMGQFASDRIQELIFRFIERYVLCKSCRNPETDVTLGSKQRIHLECRGCGKKSDVNAADKTANLVIIHYTNLAKASVKEKKGKKDAGEEKKAASPTTAEAPAMPQETQAAAAKSAKATIESTAEERENPVDVLGRMLIGNYNVDNAASHVFRLKSDYNLKDANVLRLVFRAIVQSSEKEDHPKFIEAIRFNLPLLKRFTDKEDSQKILIRECQLFCSKHKMHEKFMMTMKLLVEEGVVADTEVYAWYTGKAKDISEEESIKIKEISKPFIDWLKAE